MAFRSFAQILAEPPASNAAVRAEQEREDAEWKKKHARKASKALDLLRECVPDPVKVQEWAKDFAGRRGSPR